MTNQLYNNIGINALGIAFTVQRSGSLSLPKALLIMPFLTHKQLLAYLARSNSNVKNLEKLIIDNTSWFSNFNQRYLDTLPLSLNSVQLLSEIELLTLKDKRLTASQELEYNTDMGKRAQKIHQAANSLANILSDAEEKLYLNLRIEL